MIEPNQCLGELLFIPLFIAVGILLAIGDTFTRRIFREIRANNPKLCEDISKGHSPDLLLGHSRALDSTPMMMRLMGAIYRRQDKRIITQVRQIIFLAIYGGASILLALMVLTLGLCW